MSDWNLSHNHRCVTCGERHHANEMYSYLVGHQDQEQNRFNVMRFQCKACHGKPLKIEAYSRPKDKTE